MGCKINDGRIRPKAEKTFGKNPRKGKNRNRSGNTKNSFLSSEEKIVSERIKPKFSGKTPSLLTGADRKYLRYLQSLDVVCFVCGEQNGIEWHHVKRDSTDKKDHTRLIPLCGVEHHRLGAELSAHRTPVKFRETYPVEVQMEYAAKIYENYLKEL